ncbi:MAG: hypothetical protein QOJ60_1921 [Actinomycetota bacterium]|nr:hypothetical protein [Actinomycetota bacterium]
MLLPLAERWGVGDDYDREAMVSAASEAELTSLASAVDAVSVEDLYEWLAGPESRSATPTQEYVAVTSLTMAADSARLKMGRR